MPVPMILLTRTTGPFRVGACLGIKSLKFLHWSTLAVRATVQVAMLAEVLGICILAIFIDTGDPHLARAER
ncbi:MAG: hypothetical protein SGPRY_004136 [Prymnesium sp.]